MIWKNKFISNYKRYLYPSISLFRFIRSFIDAKIAFKNPSRPPILIYQMGKVGSTTIYNSLKNSLIQNPIFHLHFLSNDLVYHRRRHKEAGLPIAPYHIYLGEALSKALPHKRNFSIKIISLVRDPISRIISSLFQNPYFSKDTIISDDGLIEPNKVIDYIGKYIDTDSIFDYNYKWFDRELKKVFGIDVFAEPFSVDTGFSYYSKGNVDALIIRLEDLSKCGPEAISEFLNTDKPIMINQSNVRILSKEKDLYQKVLEDIYIDRMLCKKIYSSKFVRHFYNDALIEKFICRWSNE